MKPCHDGVRTQFDVVVDEWHAMRPAVFIRTNDAIHLAAARCAGETEIVATDKRMREAALALCLTVFPPP